MKPLAIIGSVVVFYKSDDDFQQNKPYTTIGYGDMYDEPYRSFLKKLHDSKRIRYEVFGGEKLLSEEEIEIKVKPWEEQQKALDSLLQAGRLCGSIQAPTGSGKTNIISYLVAAKNTSSLIIVPSASLVAQTVARLKSILLLHEDRIGAYGGGKKQIRPITVATWQSLQSKTTFQEFLSAKFGLVIVDEAHRSSANVLSTILSAYPSKYKFGLSATPFHSDYKNTERMKSLLGDIVFKISAESLYKNKNLIRPSVTVVETGCRPDIKKYIVDGYIKKAKEHKSFIATMKKKIEKHNGAANLESGREELRCIAEQFFELDKNYGLSIASSFDSSLYPSSGQKNNEHFKFGVGIYKSGIDEDIERETKIVEWIASHATDLGKTMVLFNTVEKCYRVSESFKQRGVETSVLTGRTANKDRLLEEFKESDGGIKLGTTALLGEGLDIPPLETLVIGSPIHPPFFDLARTIQVPGRVIRACEGKESARVILFKDDYVHGWISASAKKSEGLMQEQLNPLWHVEQCSLSLPKMSDDELFELPGPCLSVFKKP